MFTSASGSRMDRGGKDAGSLVEGGGKRLLLLLNTSILKTATGPI